VQAFQDSASLKCQSMQVTLDKFISFKEGQKDKQDAKLEKLVCESRVFAEDKTLTPEGKLRAWKRLWGTALDADNPEGRMIVPGPGRVDNVSEGAADLNPAGSAPAQPGQPAPKAPAPDAKQEVLLKFTRVDFEGRMFGNNKPGFKHAIFYDHVEVFHQPGDDPNVQVNPNQPPKDGFYMRCNNLNVSTLERDGKSSQYMVAKGSAFFRTPEFFGNADTIKYDESQEIVIFEGNPTTLFKLVPGGGKPQRIQGTKILYNRKTGTFTLEGGQVIQSSSLQQLNKDRDADSVARTRNSKRSVVARLDFDRQHEQFFRFGVVAGDDRQVLAAHRAVDDFALVRRRDREADLVVLVGPMLDDDLGGLVVHELEDPLLIRRQ
jgi:hypothetical protein